MIYADAVSVTVNLKDGMWLSEAAVVESARAHTSVSGVSFPYATFEALQSQVFEILGEPYAYSVAIVHRQVEQGGSSATVEVLIDFMSIIKTVEVAVLAELIAKLLSDEIDRRQHRDE